MMDPLERIDKDLYLKKKCQIRPRSIKLQAIQVCALKMKRDGNRATRSSCRIDLASSLRGL